MRTFWYDFNSSTCCHLNAQIIHFLDKSLSQTGFNQSATYASINTPPPPPPPSQSNILDQAVEEANLIERLVSYLGVCSSLTFNFFVTAGLTTVVQQHNTSQLLRSPLFRPNQKLGITLRK